MLDRSLDSKHYDRSILDYNDVSNDSQNTPEIFKINSFFSFILLKCRKDFLSKNKKFQAKLILKKFKDSWTDYNDFPDIPGPILGRFLKFKVKKFNKTIDCIEF